MVLSKREQLILMVTLACVGLLVGVKFIFDPVMAKLDDMEVERAQLEGKVEEAATLLDNQRRIQKSPTWKTLMADSSWKANVVESRVSSTLTNWSDQAGLSLSSIKPDRGTSDKGMQELIFTVAGRGSLDAVARFLWDIETSELPLKIKDIQIGSSSDEGQSMSLQLHLSALYLSAENKPSPKKAPEANDEEDI